MSKSEFGKTVEKLNEQRGQELMPCRYCDTPTQPATLAQYGARCMRCYESFCNAAFERQPPRNDTPTQADMRKRLHHGKPANVLQCKDESFDPAAIEAAKREQQRRVDEYVKRGGMALPADPHHSRVRS